MPDWLHNRTINCMAERSWHWMTCIVVSLACRQWGHLLQNPIHFIYLPVASWLTDILHMNCLIHPLALLQIACVLCISRDEICWIVNLGGFWTCCVFVRLIQKETIGSERKCNDNYFLRLMHIFASEILADHSWESTSWLNGGRWLEYERYSFASTSISLFNSHLLSINPGYFVDWCPSTCL